MNEEINIGILINSFIKSAPAWVYPPLIFLYIMHKWYPKQEKKICSFFYDFFTKKIARCDNNVLKVHREIEELKKDIQEIKKILKKK